MISITDNAVQKLKEFVEPWEIVRLAVDGGGCNGFQYSFGVQREDAVDKEDHITKAAHGVRLCVDPISYMYLANVEIDFEQSTFSSAFKINNPDITGSCGCGKSFN